MKKIKRLILGLSLLISVSAQANEIPPFALITIPKAGSHLMMKSLHYLTGGVSAWHTSFPSAFYIPGNEGFLYTHFCLSPQLEQDYADLPRLKKIILIRDLRDVCVSVVNQIKKAPWPGMTAAQRSAFKAMSFHDQLLYVINYEYDVNEVASYAPNSLQVSMTKVASQAHNYSKNAKNLVCRYENLVGPNGGGSEEAQLAEIQKIAEFLNIELSEDRSLDIASKLYGDDEHPFGKTGFENFTSTFQRGKTGAWTKYFQEDHKEAFKKKLGSYLIAWGYEEDNSW